MQQAARQAARAPATPGIEPKATEDTFASRIDDALGINYEVLPMPAARGDATVSPEAEGPPTRTDRNS